MRVVQLSDIHFGGEDAAALDAATTYVTADPPDLVMVTGDLTLNGTPREFRSAELWLARLPNPLLVTPGNHDTPYWNLPLRALQPFKRYRRFIGQPSASRYDVAGLHARTINTSRGAQPRFDWSKGAVSLKLASAAAEAITAFPADEIRIIGCHHPLMEITGTPVTGGVHRGQTAAKLFCDRGIDIILTGHVHTPFAVALPFGDGQTYAVGAGTLSVRTRGAPPGFNVLEISPGCVEVTALGWIGAALEIHRVWRLPRRSAPEGAAPEPKLSRAEVVVQNEGPSAAAGPS
ncbi:metallophosphoesterase [Caulobacter sp. S45]|uniref:metallophosphoesterase family protein n=1 Tax=Caulobacter sp. S45 TaxID=1641861 RepID=UPI00157529D1|nr:metallophosphoesterase [Caulobacter sp. S45]